MLYTPHFLIGAVIVKHIPNPYISWPLALLSHVALDLLPHWDFDITPGMGIKEILFGGMKTTKILLISMGLDILFLLVSFIWIFSSFHNYSIVAGGIIAILPDGIEQGLLLFGMKIPGWQDKFQFRVAAKWGFYSYFIVSLLALYLLVY